MRSCGSMARGLRSCSGWLTAAASRPGRPSWPGDAALDTLRSDPPARSKAVASGTGLRPSRRAGAGRDTSPWVEGGNSAGQAAVFLAGLAAKVSILVREDSLAATMSRYLIERIEALPNIEVVPRQNSQARRLPRIKSGGCARATDHDRRGNGAADPECLFVPRRRARDAGAARVGRKELRSRGTAGDPSRHCHWSRTARACSRSAMSGRGGLARRSVTAPPSCHSSTPSSGTSPADTREWSPLETDDDRAPGKGLLDRARK